MHARQGYTSPMERGSFFSVACIILCSILGVSPILSLLPIPFLAMRGQVQVVDLRGHRMGETPKTEHNIIRATWKGFLIQ